MDRSKMCHEKLKGNLMKTWQEATANVYCLTQKRELRTGGDSDTRHNVNRKI